MAFIALSILPVYQSVRLRPARLSDLFPSEAGFPVCNEPLIGALIEPLENLLLSPSLSVTLELNSSPVEKFLSDLTALFIRVLVRSPFALSVS